MLLEVNRKLLARSERVKSVDFHPIEPWLLVGLYSGKVLVWHTETGALLKTFTPTEVPVRCARFIARKNWFVCGSDDFHLRVFNYNTTERITSFEAHPDYIRCLAVHPTQPLILTGSDDMTIKLWNWEHNWKCAQVFEGHAHYIMNIAFNPKDSNTFASSCLDRTVKVWSLGSTVANFTLDAHDKGVNYVEYYHGGDKPYMVTTGDDRLIKVWDYHSKSCVQTLEGHQGNVSFAIFHPSLPILVSGSEDGTLKIWHASTYRLENTLNYGLERSWCVAYATRGNDVGFGFDEGSVVVKLGREEPSVSMDVAGKVVFARNAEVVTANVGAHPQDDVEDGEKLNVQVRELGNSDVFAQSLQHSPNGRFVTVCGDGEFIIYTALAWRNKAFGSGVGFAWASDSNTYAVRENGPKVKVFRNFKERPGLVKVNFTTDGIFGGPLLCVKGMGFVCFYDWDNGALVRRVEVEARDVSWSGSGNYLIIAGNDSFFTLRYDREAYARFVEEGGDLGDEGVEAAFELEHEFNESVKTGKWIGDCFVYTNATNRLNYLIGGQTHTLSHFDQQMYLLGYLPTHNRVYLCDKDRSIYSYKLALSVIEYQTAILREDFDAATALLPSVPPDQRNRIARFLEAEGLKDLALGISTDVDHRFDLATQLGDLELALEIVRSAPEAGAASKWRTLGDKALESWKIDLAEECFEKAGDVTALLLIYTSTGDKIGLSRLAKLAISRGQNNVAFAASMQSGSASDCVDLLMKTNRIPEAAFFARTYAPSQVPHVTKAWRKELEDLKKGKLAANIADPEETPDVFEEGWEGVLAKEQEFVSTSGLKVDESKPTSLIVDAPTVNGISHTDSNKTSPTVDEQQGDAATAASPTSDEQQVDGAGDGASEEAVLVDV